MDTSGFLSAMQAWLNKPFSSDMSVLRWFAFFGLLIAIGAFWRVIISHIEEV